MCIRDRDYLGNKFSPYLSPFENKTFVEEKRCDKNLNDYFVDVTLMARQVSTEKISVFNKIHFTLFSTCNLLNSYISLQLFLAVLKVSFNLITFAISSFGTSKDLHSLKITYLLIVSPSVACIYLICHMCYSVKLEVSILPTTLRLFMNCTRFYCVYKHAVL